MRSVAVLEPIRDEADTCANRPNKIGQTDPIQKCVAVRNQYCMVTGTAESDSRLCFRRSKVENLL